jgi:hypothetical protein
VLTAAGTVAFRRLGARLKALDGHGYDDFQKAGSARQIRHIRDGWGPEGLALARRAWLLDLAYPICYALLLAGLASLCATHADSLGWGAFSNAMTAVSRFALAAGGVDLLVENAAVAVGLWRTPGDTAARVARGAGVVKSLLLGVVLLALAGAAVAFLVAKL